MAEILNGSAGSKSSSPGHHHIKRMNYAETRAYLNQVTRTGIKYDLQNIRRMLDLLEHPERSFPVICVCGTNGKGSTCAFLESILAEAGYKAGLNTSPHLVSPRERLRINRTIATEDDFSAAINKINEIALSGWGPEDPGRPTFFETMTSAALHYFREQKVDIALMEAGLGGRLDGTNGTQPLFTIVTRIGVDHPKTLGNTMRKIAFEKFGLARNGKKLIIAKQRKGVRSHLLNHCRFRGAIPEYVESSWKKKKDGLELTTRRGVYSALELALPGKFQLENAANAVYAIEELRLHGFRITEEHVRAGLRNAFWPGRMEYKDAEPRLLIDGSHNTDGMAHFIEELRKIPAKRRILIFAKMGDKKLAQTAGKLIPLVDSVYLPQVPVGRAADPQELKVQIEPWFTGAVPTETVKESWELALKEYREGDLIIVAGSLYLVGHFKKAIGDKLG